MDKLPEKAHEEVLTIFEATVEDIDRTKQWLWTVTYHTIIAQGGLLALHATYTSSHTWTKWLFLALSVGIGFVGSYHVDLARMALKHFRERLNRCKDQFEPISKEVFGGRSYKRDVPSMSIIWITTAVVLLLIYFSPGTPNPVAP